MINNLEKRKKVIQKGICNWFWRKKKQIFKKIPKDRVVKRKNPLKEKEKTL